MIAAPWCAKIIYNIRMFKGANTKIAGAKHMLREQATMVRRKQRNPGHFGRLRNPGQTHFCRSKKRTCPGKRGRMVTLHNNNNNNKNKLIITTIIQGDTHYQKNQNDFRMCEIKAEKDKERSIFIIPIYLSIYLGARAPSDFWAKWVLNAASKRQKK